MNMTHDPHHRDKVVTKVLAWILLANMGVAIAKISYGLFSHSLAIRADGFHSLLDGINNILAIFIIRVAARPPDSDHPYGHRKFEFIGSLAIGVLLVLLLMEISADIVGSLRGKQTVPDIGVEAYVLILTTLFINIAVTIIEHRAGAKLDSPLLLADAKHTLSDVFVTAAVLAGIFGTRNGFPFADTISSIAVLSIIGWIGYTIFRSGIGVLADEVALPAHEIQGIAQKVPGVQNCYRIRSRGGAHDIRVDLIIQVNKDLTITDAHKIGDQVENAIESHYDQVSEVVVHVEPEGAHGRKSSSRRINDRKRCNPNRF